MDKQTILLLRIFSLILWMTAGYSLSLVDWRIGLGVFLAFWANNIDKSRS